MGEPVKISYLAEQMIRLSGRIPGEDIEIIYVGLRPGEKLYEELFHEKEQLKQTEHEKVFLAHHRKVDWDSLTHKLEQMVAACETMDEAKLSELLEELVPEHRDTVDKSASTTSSANVLYLIPSSWQGDS
jgi:FlaA1/EpsC-like NDP-sugar epimerase